MAEKQLGHYDGRILVDHLNVRQSISIILCKLLVIEFFFTLVAISYQFLNLPFTNFPFFLCLVAIKTFFVIYVTMKWTYEYYEIFPEAVIHHKGIIFRIEEKYAFNQIRSIKIDQGVMGRLFNFGTLTFYDWHLQKESSMYLIHNPRKHFKILEGLMPRTSEEKHMLRERFREGED